jgi:hypothetical protein
MATHHCYLSALDRMQMSNDEHANGCRSCDAGLRSSYLFKGSGRPTNAAPQSKGHCPTLERLSHADPAADAQAAVSRRDCHLLMLGGYVGTVPGGEMSFRREQAEMMPDTGDVVTNDACPALRPVAERYALKYNETVLALDRGTVPKCPPPTAGSPSQRLLGTPSTESKSQ